MFRISQEQIEAFEQIARINFYRRLAAYLREVLPEEAAAYEGDALLGYIEECTHRASKYRIETESGIAQWACLALMIGLDFDEEPAIQEYFKASGVEPDEKLDALVEGMNGVLDGSRAEPGSLSQCRN